MNAQERVSDEVMRVVPSTVYVVIERTNACSDNTSAGTSAARASTLVLTPGGDFLLLVLGAAAFRLFVSVEYVNVLIGRFLLKVRRCELARTSYYTSGVLHSPRKSLRALPRG